MKTIVTILPILLSKSKSMYTEVISQYPIVCLMHNFLYETV